MSFCLHQPVEIRDHGCELTVSGFEEAVFSQPPGSLPSPWDGVCGCPMASSVLNSETCIGEHQLVFEDDFAEGCCFPAFL